MNQTIVNKLLNPTHYIVVPQSLKTVQLPFDDMVIANTNPIEYLTPIKLEQDYKELLSLVDVLDATHFMMRYGIDADTLALVEAFLESLGYVNIRKNVDGSYKILDQIDFTAFTGNEFLIIPMYMGKDVPKTLGGVV
ncbi:hypothetical protein PGH07_07760 [Sulfurovum sp. zt1-1]|uniref:Uncharacterized protein n=1 Tax=Sulfurovum zhangzhouensis TaxID=3019067 RepID=A0ABT7QZ10_9BACT|nr:hypothetical protein [Sulfurovum zhangzhouensis]MDM5272072.1 hypothetical protein [Sulfurovum zhangzhouensis]